jgi:phosphotransferase system enzyme I (PtsI)
MAGDPLLTPLLIGLGIDELSMAPASVPAVKNIIRSITVEQAQVLAELALVAGSSAEVMEHCRKLIAAVAPETLELVQ